MRSSSSCSPRSCSSRSSSASSRRSFWTLLGSPRWSRSSGPLRRPLGGRMEYSSSFSSAASRPASIGKIKGSSFFIWFLVGFCLPLLGRCWRSCGAGSRTSRSAGARSAARRAGLRPGLHELRQGPASSRRALDLVVDIPSSAACAPSTPSWNASRPRASSTYSASPAARTCRPTTPSTTRGVRHIQCRHEQGAGHAAEGYAKARAGSGVALATSGPGATNLVTPIADAMMDSVPTVFITGQVRTDLIGTDGFQEADITGITMPIVKHSMMIQDPREIPRGDPRGVPHRPHGAPRAGAGGHPAGPLARGHPVRARRPTSTCPATSRPPRATSSRSAWRPRRSPTRAGP